MTPYKLTICRNEDHFNHILKVLGSKGYRCTLEWHTLKDRYKDDPDRDLALFWCDVDNVVVWGHTGYEDNRNYFREDIGILPDDLFEIG